MGHSAWSQLHVCEHNCVELQSAVTVCSVIASYLLYVVYGIKCETRLSFSLATCTEQVASWVVSWLDSLWLFSNIATIEVWLTAVTFWTVLVYMPLLRCTVLRNMSEWVSHAVSWILQWPPVLQCVVRYILITVIANYSSFKKRGREGAVDFRKECQCIVLGLAPVECTSLLAWFV